MTTIPAGSSDQADRFADSIEGGCRGSSRAEWPFPADPWAGLAMQDFRLPGPLQSTSPRRPRTVRPIVSWSVFVLLCVAFWLVAGPAQLGGPAHYVIVDGPSMEPAYHEGDLVIARAKESYEVGDVVAYQPEIGQRFPVIHRIIEIAGDGQYITKGDNRDEADGWLAADSNIFGAEWLRIPYGGRVLLYLRQPTPWLAAAAGLSALGLFSRARQVRYQKTHAERGSL